jgi:hypothetical protein
MPRPKRVTTKSGEKISKAKEIPADMDLGQTDTKLHSHRVARPEPANVQAAANNPQATRVGESSLTALQREEITEALTSPDRPSLSEIARRNGASFHAVQRLAVKIAEQESPRGDTVIGRYQRRLAKRLPVRVRTDILADVATGRIGPAAGRVQLDAIKRADELDGVVTAEKRQESESNVRVGPLFVLPAAASPALDVALPNARRSQDES